MNTALTSTLSYLPGVGGHGDAVVVGGHGDAVVVGGHSGDVVEGGSGGSRN